MAQKKGYTYLELVMVIAIFSIIAVLIGGIFVLFTKAESRTSMRQKLIAEGRYIMETIVREIRSGKIDYPAYNPPVKNPQNVLYILNEKDNLIRFSLSENECPEGIQKCIFYVRSDSGGLLSAADINVDYLDFYIKPVNDPFIIEDGRFLDDKQPSVTIILGLSYPGSSDQNEELISIKLQTTVSSKVYER